MILAVNAEETTLLGQAAGDSGSLPYLERVLALEKPTGRYIHCEVSALHGILKCLLTSADTEGMRADSATGH